MKNNKASEECLKNRNIQRAIKTDKWKSVHQENPITMSWQIILWLWNERIIAVTRILSVHWRLMLLSVLIGCNIGVVQCSGTNNNYASPDHQQQNGKESAYFTFGSAQQFVKESHLFFHLLLFAPCDLIAKITM